MGNTKYNKKINIFDYVCYRDYLRDFYNNKKEMDRRFSYRFFAKKAGLKAYNLLQLVIAGKRNITPNSITNFAKGLELDKKELEYFNTLVEYGGTTSTELKSHLLEKILLVKKKHDVKELNGDQCIILKDWYNTVIYEMFFLKDCANDPYWMAKKLKNRVSPLKIREAISALKEAGLLKEEKGSLVPIQGKIKTPRKSELFSILKNNYHLKMMELSKEVVLGETNDKKEFHSLAFAISDKTIVAAREKIVEFIRDLTHFVSEQQTDKVNPPEHIATLGVQFFTLT